MPLFSLQAIAHTADVVIGQFFKEFNTISAPEFRTLLHKERRKAKLLDVSSQVDYRELHIPGSINFDLDNSRDQKRFEQLDRSKTYFIYCRNGRRSESAYKLMEEMGFRRVYQMLHGMANWKGTVARLY